VKRFILNAPPDAAGSIRLTGDDYHYLARVRRLGAGDVFRVLLPDGVETRALVQSVRNGEMLCSCLAPSGRLHAGRKNASSLPPIALFQSLPKGAKIDHIIRQAAEGGVSEIIPFVSGFSVPKPEQGGGKAERWRRIVKEARQQSGSDIATEVREPAALDEALAYWEALKARYKNPAGILLHQDPLESGGFHRALAETPDFAAAVVGPEGGFSNEEAARFMEAGFKPLVLGANVLRAETAAVYAIAAIRIILLESEEWTLKKQ
jgi:16S rRNA (uracil1498-N3)-methyltransferase